ncbi:acylphosphatase [Sphingobium sp. CAP-1]|uniref:acylphosphatase n=1 Tax=Sphingobium sp. CAP-1 TaxID=2676077 RepID=UPI0012BB45BF|nr:acylphosphatase [Sphingobium sp. CAP-1]QGP78443.1 acylphosphatase [Sphingobium sp. CAP-1]
MAPVARHLMIHGRVQGVWYRGWTVETARGLGLTGWVRNCADGCVEALVQGEAEAVARFIALAQDGPVAAQVARIDAADATVEVLDGFRKRPTA